VLAVCAVTLEVTVAFLTSVNRKMCLKDKFVISLGTRDFTLSLNYKKKIIIYQYTLFIFIYLFI